MIKYILLLFLMFFFSCSSEYNNLSKIGSSYRKLSNIEDITLYYRSRGQTLGSSIYGVNTYEASCSPYFVEINKNKFEISEINKNLRFGSCTELISEDKIRKVLQFAVENNISYLKINNIGDLMLGKNKQFILPKSKASGYEIKKYVKIHAGWYQKESDIPIRE